MCWKNHTGIKEAQGDIQNLGQMVAKETIDIICEIEEIIIDQDQEIGEMVIS